MRYVIAKRLLEQSLYLSVSYVIAKRLLVQSLYSRMRLGTAKLCACETMMLDKHTLKLTLMNTIDL